MEDEYYQGARVAVAQLLKLQFDVDSPGCSVLDDQRR